MVGKLNFLKKSARPDISYATQQVARFSENPKVSHGKAIEHIVKYLCNTCNDVIILWPVEDKLFEIFANADFVGNWHQMTMLDDPSKYCQIPLRIRDQLCRLSDRFYIQIADNHHTFKY
jgi:hypothetical protein